METKDLIEIVQNVKEKSNKDLIEGRDLLLTEFNKTKELILSLTRHLDTVQEYYETINTEIGKRII